MVYFMWSLWSKISEIYLQLRNGLKIEQIAVENPRNFIEQITIKTLAPPLRVKPLS